MKRWIALLCIVGLGGCSADQMAAMDSAQLACDDVTAVALTVTPDVLARGEAVSVTVEWVLSGPVLDPVVAILKTGAGYNTEVELPLEGPQSTTDGTSVTYTGSMLNPFGLGLAEGSVSVVTRVLGPDTCTAIESVASFSLE